MLSSKLATPVLILSLVAFTPGAPAGAGDDSSSEAIRRGAVIYARACVACHGRNGEGDGPGAAELNPWPRDFKSGKYRIRSTHSGEAPRREDIEGAIRRGMPGTSMPAFEGLLSDEDLAAVVTFILDMGPSSLVGREPEALTIPEFPAPDATGLADGRAVYLVVGCWKCHGLDGSGRGPSAKGLRSDEGQPIRPRNFRYDPFKGGRSPETVARAALSGLIGTPMPSHAEVMAVPREAIDFYADSIPAEARVDLEDFRRKAPAAAEVLAMDDDAWQELRDRNLVSLAQYVLSLDRRNRLGYQLFRQRPEQEGRRP